MTTLMHKLILKGKKVHLNTVAHAIVGTVVEVDPYTVLLKDAELIGDEGDPAEAKYARVYNLKRFGDLCINLETVVMVRKLS